MNQNNLKLKLNFSSIKPAPLNLSYNKRASTVVLNTRFVRPIVNVSSYTCPSRTMFTVNNSSKKVIANTFFQGLKYVTKPSVLENITPKDPSPLVESIIEYTVDDQIGTPQHKGAFMFNLFRQKFTVGLFQKALDKQVPNSLIEWPKQGLADTRVVSEIPVAIAIAKDLPYINKLSMTNDQLPSNPTHPNFISRKQSNTDLETELKGPYGDKSTYMDVKSGADMVDMVEHTTRGHAGIISLFENQIIPFTINKQHSSAQVFDVYNSLRVRHLKSVIGIDKPGTDFSPTLNKVYSIYDNFNHLKQGTQAYNNSPSYTSIQLHNKVQHLLWSEIQCHPDFKRSVSVIFVKTINRLPTDAEFNNYLNKINNLLPNGHYNMSKQSDKKLLLKISVKAYLETVDSKVHDKFLHLAQNNIQLDDIMLQILHDISTGKFV